MSAGCEYATNFTNWIWKRNFKPFNYLSVQSCSGKCVMNGCFWTLKYEQIRFESISQFNLKMENSIISAKLRMVSNEVRAQLHLSTCIKNGKEFNAFGMMDFTNRLSISILKRRHSLSGERVQSISNTIYCECAWEWTVDIVFNAHDSQLRLDTNVNMSWYVKSFTDCKMI